MSMVITMIQSPRNKAYNKIQSVEETPKSVATKKNHLENHKKSPDNPQDIYDGLLRKAYDEVMQIPSDLPLTKYPPSTKALIDISPLTSQIKTILSGKICHSPLHRRELDDAIQRLFGKPKSICKAIRTSNKSYGRLLSTLVNFAFKELGNGIYEIYQEQNKFSRFVCLTSLKKERLMEPIEAEVLV